MRGSEQVYFDAAVTLLFFLLVGRFLDQRCACARAARRRISLGLQGGIATVIQPDGAQLQVPAHALEPGMRILVAAGERFAADGGVLDGTGEVDESLITGETAPRTVRAGQRGLCRHGQPVAAAGDRGHRHRQRNAARRDRAADGGGRAGRGALRAPRRPRGALYAPAVHGLGLATFLGWLLAGAGGRPR